MVLYISGRKEKERLVEALLEAYSRANTKHDYETVEILLKLLNRIEKCEKMQNRK